MAFGDRIKDWFGWDDDDDSAFDDDLWDTLGIDQDDDPDTWWDDLTTTITPTDDPYGIGSFFDDTYNFGDWGGDDDSWDPPTGTVNPWEDEAGLWDSDTGGLLRDLFGVKDPDADPYGIGSYFGDSWGDTGSFFQNELGGWGDDTPTVDFEDPDFNWGEFDVDSYLDGLLDPNWGGGTEGDPSDWFINTGDPAYQDYSGVGGGMPGPPSIADFDTSILDEIEKAGGLDAFLPVTDVDFWENVRDESGNIDPSLFTGPRSRGPLGGGIGPWLRNLFLGSGGTGENKQGSGIMGLLNSLLGGGDGGGLLGGGGLGTLASLWALNKARKEGSDPGAVIPMGQQAYGMDDVYGGPTQDYRVFNIQPALMPGVAYANVGKPEGMKFGGIKDGPGDITPAWLEPGEFVVTKKAVDNMGARNLYKMMKDAEGMG